MYVYISLLLDLPFPLLQAWNDLSYMGYRSNLTAGLGHGDEVYGLAPVVKDAQRRPVLPELTKKALTR